MLNKHLEKQKENPQKKKKKTEVKNYLHVSSPTIVN